jgi:RNase adaptor protein for sRNA GlmZ degradation
MANTILIYGESGTGKSTSIQNLDPKSTFIVNVLGKALPFKGYKKNYITKTKENSGNIVTCDKSSSIMQMLVSINELPEIKTVIIDDFQYIMGNEFMRRAAETGWQKFTDIGQNAWNIIAQAGSLRDDLKVFVLSHAETNENTGKTKIKTIGKMLDEKICLEGMFTVVLYSTISQNGEYGFITQNTGLITAKSPHGMFDKLFIPNDLQTVIEKINAYENDSDINL